MSNTLFQALKGKSLIGLAFVLFIGLTGCQPAEEGEEAETPAEHDHSKHHHGLLDVKEQWPDAAIPNIEIEVLADSMSGWNIKIITENFDFAPDKVNQDATPNEGHAHLFVDNYKFARLYGNWYHLKALTPGKHEVKVTLNANDHSSLGFQGKEISAAINIEQK